MACIRTTTLQTYLPMSRNVGSPSLRPPRTLPNKALREVLKYVVEPTYDDFFNFPARSNVYGSLALDSPGCQRSGALIIPGLRHPVNVTNLRNRVRILYMITFSLLANINSCACRESRNDTVNGRLSSKSR